METNILKMTHGSLFSGIGGFDLAAEWMGWENIFHCEWNPFGQKVLKHHFPNSISYNDITKTDFSIHRGKIDILTGGFPCQPYSTAGKRQGKADERHLFPEMLRCIKEIKPRWIIGENVRGLVSWNGGLVFNEVYDDLEREGYEVQSFLIPAASVNAPHQRYRIWFIAYNDANPSSIRFREHSSRKESFVETLGTQYGMGKGDAPNSNSQRANGQFENRTLCKDGSKDEPNGIQESKRADVGRNDNGTSNERDASNSNPSRCKDRDKQYRRQSTQTKEGKYSIGRHSFGSASNTNDSRANELLRNIRGGEEVNQGQEELTQSKFGEGSCPKFEGWEEFPTQSPICGGDDGIPRELDSITFSKWRNESIKAYGNAIVPQVAHQLFKTIQEFENKIK